MNFFSIGDLSRVLKSCLVYIPHIAIVAEDWLKIVSRIWHVLFGLGPLMQKQGFFFYVFFLMQG